MTEELYTLPDGKYVIPIELRGYTRQSVTFTRTSGDAVVIRVGIEGGHERYKKYASHVGWYKNTIDGRESSYGHTHIDTLDDLKNLCHPLPYSWRV